MYVRRNPLRKKLMNIVNMYESNLRLLVVLSGVWSQKECIDKEGKKQYFKLGVKGLSSDSTVLTTHVNLYCVFPGGLI